MFLAGERPEIREKKIRGFLQKEPGVAVLLAAAQFEWTLGRTLLFLGRDSNAALRERLAVTYGLEHYKKLWKEELSPRQGYSSLPDVVRNWERVRDAYRWRGLLIHGRDRCTANMALPEVEALLQAATYVRQYCESQGIEFTARLPVRTKKKDSPTIA